MEQMLYVASLSYVPRRPSAGWAVLAGAGGGPQLLYRLLAARGSELEGRKRKT